MGKSGGVGPAPGGSGIVDDGWAGTEKKRKTSLGDVHDVHFGKIF